MNICNIRTTRIENKINYTHADLYRINYSMYEKSTDINLKKKVSERNMRRIWRDFSE